MAGEQETKTFIRATFRSVWALELLCHLRKHPGIDHSPAQIIEALRASEGIVRLGLGGLVAAGLIHVNEQGDARYGPANAELDNLANAAEDLYAKSPNAVRRLIVEGANPGITAFADAFKLRADK